MRRTSGITWARTTPKREAAAPMATAPASMPSWKSSVGNGSADSGSWSSRRSIAAQLPTSA